MSLKNQLSFGSGELTPILHDRVTLERFQNALATARNAMIGRTGTILSRFSTEYLITVTHQGPVVMYTPSGSGQLFEFGIDSTNDKFYYKVYNSDGGSLHSYEDPILGDSGIDVDNIYDLQFVTGKEYIYIFGGSTSTINLHRVRYGGVFGTELDVVFDSPIPPVSVTGSGTGSGYAVDYAVTYVINGEESRATFTNTPGVLKPILVTESFDLTVSIIVGGNIDDYNEVRIYRRPREGAAYGFLGTSTFIYDDAGTLKADFTDIGANADFTNGIPTLVTREGVSNNTIYSDHIIGTGTIYQGRFMMANFINDDDEAIAASRPGYLRNFYRDYPYDADSSLLFKEGSEGKAKVLRMIDKDGLVLFTTRGVFASVGLLSINNLALEKRGSWIIDENIPPLVIPGALLFVDKTTNTVRQLVFSQELGGYDSIDQSVFSSHLFKQRTIKSWGYQEGQTPLLVVIFSDGTFATFTYSFEHRMRAWTRHDSRYSVEQVQETGVSDLTFFLINKDGTRQIEKSVPRFIPADVFVANPEADKYVYGAFMDSAVERFTLVNDSLIGTDTLLLVPVTPAVWDGNLTLTCGTSGLFFAPGLGTVGTVMRVFNTDDKTVIDLTVVSRTDDNTLVVLPSELFPEAQATTFRLYETHVTVLGLAHLEGEEVSVMVDGNVLSSPNNDNDDESSTTLTVSAGTITIPEQHRSAITIVGRPITADVKSLNISTVEQSPTTLESLTVNKIYVRVHESRGLYVDNEFPENKVDSVDGDTVADMQDLDKYSIKSGVPIIANRYKQPISERVELTLPGSWESQGQMALRQVDPVHFEILSIIADVEIERRGRE